MFGGNRYCGERRVCAECFCFSGLVEFSGGGVTEFWGEVCSKKPIIIALGERHCHVAVSFVASATALRSIFIPHPEKVDA